MAASSSLLADAENIGHYFKGQAQTVIQAWIFFSLYFWIYKSSSYILSFAQ